MVATRRRRITRNSHSALFDYSARAFWHTVTVRRLRWSHSMSRGPTRQAGSIRSKTDSQAIRGAGACSCRHPGRQPAVRSMCYGNARRRRCGHVPCDCCGEMIPYIWTQPKQKNGDQLPGGMKFASGEDGLFEDQSTDYAKIRDSVY